MGGFNSILTNFAAHTLLDAGRLDWRAVITAILFGIGKWLLGLYLGSGAAGSAYGPASSLITLLLWVYYSSQILLFGAEFTQVYAGRAGRAKPNRVNTRCGLKEKKWRSVKARKECNNVQSSSLRRTYFEKE